VSKTQFRLHMYLSFALLLVVFAAVFACVVFGQLILVELLELVSHRFFDTRWQRAAETLEKDNNTVKTELKHIDRHAVQWMLTNTYCAVDSDYFQPIRGQLYSRTEVSADM